MRRGALSLFLTLIPLRTSVVGWRMPVSSPRILPSHHRPGARPTTHGSTPVLHAIPTTAKTTANKDDVRIRDSSLSSAAEASSSRIAPIRRVWTPPPRGISALVLAVLCGLVALPWTVHATVSSTTAVTATAAAFLRSTSLVTRDVSMTTPLSWPWIVVALVTWMCHGVQQGQHVLLLPMLTHTLQTGAQWYMTQLAVHPVVTKSITAGVIGVVGDAVAQSLERWLLHRRQPVPPSPPKHSTTTSLRRWYDSRRALSILVDGVLISGPLMHYGYEFLDHIVPIQAAAGGGSSSSSAMAALLHVVADSVVLDAIFVATTFVVTGRVEGYTFRQVWPQLRQDYVPALKASWATSVFLLPIEFVCFRFLPLSFRVLAVNFIDVIWDAVISFMAHRSRPKKTVECMDDPSFGVTQTATSDS